jgi:hypothetical protein
MLKDDRKASEIQRGTMTFAVHHGPVERRPKRVHRRNVADMWGLRVPEASGVIDAGGHREMWKTKVVKKRMARVFWWALRCAWRRDRKSNSRRRVRGLCFGRRSRLLRPWCVDKVWSGIIWWISKDYGEVRGLGFEEIGR